MAANLRATSRAQAALLYIVGRRVIVCADIFDTNGGYLQGLGLGPAIDACPPRGTVFFVGTVITAINARNKLRIEFDVDKDKVLVDFSNIFRLLTDCDEIGEFWVYTVESEGPKDLKRITGVTFHGQDRRPPMKWRSNDAGSCEPLEASQLTSSSDSEPEPAGDEAFSVSKSSSSTEDDQPAQPAQPARPQRRRRRRAAVAVAVAEQEDTPPPRRRARLIRPRQALIDASDDDRDDGEEGELGVESDSDFLTDEDVEAASEHEEEVYRWQPPANWADEIRRNPELRVYAAAEWKSPPGRGELHATDTGPQQRCHFHVKPTGDTPFSDLFMRALPLRFWNSVCEETRRYAATCMADTNTPTTRTWVAEQCTPSNMIRMHVGVILRGLINSAGDAYAFANETRMNDRYRRTGLEELCGISLNLFQQLLRYLHLRDNGTRPNVTSDDHDKLFHVRPVITALQKAFREWCTPGKNNAMDEAGLPSR